MKFKTYGKINLFLNVVGKREDGYHNIETIIQRIDLFDEIEIFVDRDFDGIEINISCNKDFIVPVDEKNLCYIACKWFMERYGLKGRVSIFIYKNIPVKAGLGGGTSNGAEVIKALNLIYNLGINFWDLHKEISSIGADFPYFLVGGTALCEGIGEKVRKLNSFSNRWIVIVKPDFGFSTKDVYENLNFLNIKSVCNKNEIINSISQNDLNGVCKNLFNTLEFSKAIGLEKLNEIKNILKSLGACGTLMSGSGSSIFGIFENKDLAERCFSKIKDKFEEVFLCRTLDL